mmetsp:Transcript_6206/g.9191  ORF Transcript_6206/g.9191 Transcript_6206/m.9191 type:complete len:262 (+) Transcript_6206:679-1464(+)
MLNQETDLKQNLLPAQVTVETSNPKSSKDKLKQSGLPETFTMHSFVLLLQGTQIFVSLVCVSASAILEPIIGPTLYSYFWVPIVCVGVYAVVYLLIRSFEEELRGSSFNFLVFGLLTVSEAVFFTFIGVYTSSLVIFCVLSMLCGGVFTCSLFARCLRKRYSSENGRLLAILGLALVFIVFVLVFDKPTIVGVTLLGAFSCVYLWVMVSEVDYLLKDLREDQALVSCLYAQVRLCKKKCEWAVKALILPYYIIQSFRVKDD